MTTGIFIRTQHDNGKWENIDIADPRVSRQTLLAWLRSRGGQNRYAENVVGVLLGKGPLHVDGESGDGPIPARRRLRFGEQLEMFGLSGEERAHF
jgi:hypothetical protein